MRQLAASDFTFWNRNIKWQDGKASEAFAKLIRYVGYLKTSGTHRNITVVGVENKGSGSKRSQDMGNAIMALSLANPDSQIIGLLGNFHVRVIRAAHKSQSVQPTREAEVLFLNMKHAGGTAWICEQDGCGEKDIDASAYNGQGSLPVARWSIGSWDENFDGIFWLGNISASRPACLSLNSCQKGS